MKEIVVASGNKGKIKEIQNILNEFDIISIKEKNIDIDVEEDRETFEENAMKKAYEIAKILNDNMVIADDSGIEIEYLEGFPGVNSKRWMKGTDRERNLEILNKLDGIEKEKRKIRFIAAIAISNGIQTISEKGILEGYVANEIRGTNGFGFDEIFELEDGRTLAELTDEEKNKISARKIALEKIKNRIKELEVL